uniref:Uncharacterized protein n=1 Tax=Aegilops tauschii subsp. strangulata TaxID=200361 RepID=A0A453NCJ6_AEGTS
RDCKGCLVCLQGLNSSFGKDGFIVEEPLRLEVWALKKEDKQVKFCWKCEKGVRVSEMLPEDDARVYKVHKVINGLALIGCTKGSYAIDLQSMTLLAKFESGGDIYPYQMSWPPAVLAAATSVVSRHLGANLSNEDCARIPSKNMDGREGTSSGGSESGNTQCSSFRNRGGRTVKIHEIYRGKIFSLDPCYLYVHSSSNSLYIYRMKKG